MPTNPSAPAPQDHRRRPKQKPRPNHRDWGECEVCGQYLPLIAEVGMCGPCTTGDASTLLGDDDE